jgi:predicted nucleic acid-binding protein
MALVIDASMTMSWCFTDERTPYSQGVLDTLRSSYAEVPALWIVEIKNVLLINERRGRVTAQGSKEFLEALMALDIRIDTDESPFDDQHLLPLARRHGLTAYDAAYLELAKRRDLPLATFDKDLLKAAPQEGVALVPQS